MKKQCVNDPNLPEFTLINGDERQDICSVCLKDALLDLVTNNDDVTFITTRKAGSLPEIEVV